MIPALRLARPVTNLERAVAAYCDGLGLSLLDRFAGHAGFDGAMLGFPGAGWHLELTHCAAAPVVPSPTAEDLIVLYRPDPRDWQRACAAAERAGFTRVRAFNPYWDIHGRTYQDPDGYRVVLQRAAWPEPPVTPAA